MKRWLKKKFFWWLFYSEIAVSNNLVQVQSSDGNWNYDPYMHGMANGMILIEHLFHMDEGEPKYLKAPQNGWLNEND